MRERNSALDLLKFIFAWVIVLFHANKYLPGQWGYFINGRLAAEFFFLVSGCLMAATSERCRAYGPGQGGVWRTTAEYIGHRIARLSPDVFIAWFVACGVFTWTSTAPAAKIRHEIMTGIHDLLFLRCAGYMNAYAPNLATWYLSAMLLAMALLFPLLYAKRDCFLHWFAPLAAILLYGYMNIIWPTGLSSTDEWSGFALKGLMRGLAGISLGACCYTVGSALGRLRLKPPARLLTTAVELGCYIYFIRHVYAVEHTAFDHVLVFLLAVGITITYSGVSYSALLGSWETSRRGCAFLAAFSLDLYLSHIYWAKRLELILPELSGRRLLLVFLAVSLVNALLLMGVSAWLRKQWPRMRGALRRFALESGERS